MIKIDNTGANPSVLERAETHPLLDTTKTPSPFFKKINRSIVSWIEDEFERTVDFHRNDRIREDRNHRYYTALDRAQWSPEILKKVSTGELNIDLSQYNFLMKKVTGFVGTLMKNPQDVEFVSQSPDFVDGSLLCKHLMNKDRELNNWENQLRETIKNGIIYNGFIRFNVTTKHHELGNIEIKNVKPGTLLTSPEWDSDDIKDCSHYVSVSYMDAYTAKKMFPHKSGRIDDAVRRIYDNTTTYEQRDGRAFSEYDLNPIYEQKYRFIEYHHMIDEEIVQMIGLTPDGTYVDVPEPPKNLKTSDQLKSWMKAWYEINHVDPKTVFSRKHVVSRYYITTTCSMLDSEFPFDDNLAVIQCGRLPISQFSYERHGGRYIGLIDVLADPQTTFNKNMSLVMEMIARASKDGQLYEPNAFGNDPAKMDEYEKKSSRPGFRMAAEPGYIESGGRVFADIPNNSGSTQQQVIQNSNQMFDMINQLTPQNLAMEGLNESSKETGRLFMEKRNQGEVTMETVVGNLAKLNKDIGEIWLSIAMSLYGDVYRRFTDSTGKEFEINRMEYTPEGMSYIINDISMIPRQEIVIASSPSGMTQRISDRISSLELIRILPQEMKLTSMKLTERIIKGLDNYSRKDLDGFMETMEIEKALIQSQMETQIANNEATKAQAMQVIQQSQQPPAPQEGAPQEGQPQGEQPTQEPMPEGPIPPEGGSPGQEQMAVRTPDQFTE